MESVSCNFCNSPKFTLLHQIPDLLMDRKDDTFTLVKCDQCGLIYQNPRPTKDEMSEYYSNEYESFYQAAPQAWLSKKFELYGIDKRCRIVNSLSKECIGNRLLDIGCATGFFMNQLRRSNLWDVRGVEPNEYAAKTAREQFSLDVFTGDIFQANFEDNFFDVITLWDVLEHLPDPMKALNEIARITRPQGYMVIRVPNYESFDAKLYGSSWAGLDMPRHYYVFTKKNITRYLSENGYQVSSIRCNIGTYTTFLLSLRFWLTSRSVDSTFREKLFHLLNHPIAKLVSAPFFYFYGLFQLGSEITVIAKKR